MIDLTLITSTLATFISSSYILFSYTVMARNISSIVKFCDHLLNFQGICLSSETNVVSIIHYEHRGVDIEECVHLLLVLYVPLVVNGLAGSTHRPCNGLVVTTSMLHNKMRFWV